MNTATAKQDFFYKDKEGKIYVLDGQHRRMRAEKISNETELILPIAEPKPIQKKEIDLTFVQFAQRKHAAVTYIQSVESRKKNSRIKETLGNIAGAIGIFMMIYGMCIIGAFF